MESAPLGGSCDRGMVPHPRNALHQLQDQLGQIGSFRGSEETAAAVLQQAEERETSTEGSGHLTALLSPRQASAAVNGC